MLIATVGGGSNAIGLFHPFLDDAGVEIVGVEAAGEGLDRKHAASLAGGRPGILHGNKTYLLQDEDGQITEAHSISEIGRASCRERVCPYVELSVVAVYFKKKIVKLHS